MMGSVLNRVRHLRLCLIVTSIAGVIGTVVAAVMRGGPGAAGFAGGVILVIASYLISALVVAWADKTNPALVMPVGLATYGLKFFLLFLVIGVVAKIGWIGLVPLAIGIIVAVIAWTGAQLWWTWHAKLLYVDDPVGGPVLPPRLDD